MLFIWRTLLPLRARCGLGLRVRGLRSASVIGDVADLPSARLISLIQLRRDRSAYITWHRRLRRTDALDLHTIAQMWEATRELPPTSEVIWSSC